MSFQFKGMFNVYILLLKRGYNKRGDDRAHSQHLT